MSQLLERLTELKSHLAHCLTRQNMNRALDRALDKKVFYFSAYEDLYFVLRRD